MTLHQKHSKFYFIDELYLFRNNYLKDKKNVWTKSPGKKGPSLHDDRVSCKL